MQERVSSGNQEKVKQYRQRNGGDLTASIKVSAVKERNGGKYVDICAEREKIRHGVRNAEKGFVLNYGRSNMPARPWFTAANEKAADEATLQKCAAFGRKSKMKNVDSTVESVA